MKHILFDLKKCSSKLLDDENFIKESLEEASKEAKCEVLKIETHKFEPQGVTGYALLAESHISIHTWPERGVAKCDIFTCNDKNDPVAAIEYLKKKFETIHFYKWSCDRSEKTE
tara:strand:- start:253 stop:594 length:342 start_codon:yes stop_codon:yes gene_type:complete